MTEKAPLDLKCNDSKRAGALEGALPCRRLRWRFRSAESSWGAVAGLGQPTPVIQGRWELGAGGPACDFRAPPRYGQLAWGWGVTASSPRHHRRRAAAAAIREVQDGFLLLPRAGSGQRRAAPQFAASPSPYVGALGCREPRRLAPGSSEAAPLGPGRQSSGGAGGEAGAGGGGGGGKPEFREGSCGG